MSTRFYSIQYLRALAALGVVVTHASTALFDGRRALIPLDLGEAGVDIFFVVSGFVMYYTTEISHINSIEFVKRRIIRIFPSYFVLTTVAFSIAVIAPQITNTFSSNVGDYIKSLLFIPFLNERYNFLMRPLLGQGWTLNYEMYFYLIFSISMLIGRRTRLILSAGIISSVYVLVWKIGDAGPILGAHSNTIVFEFIFGMLISILYIRCRESLLTVGSALIPIYILLLCFPGVNSHIERFILYGIPSAAGLCLVLYLESRGFIPIMGWGLTLGDASYSLYLSHTFVLAVLRRIFSGYMDTSLLSTHIVFVALSVIVASAVAIIYYFSIENPTTRFLGRLYLRKKNVVAISEGAT